MCSPNGSKSPEKLESWFLMAVKVDLVSITHSDISDFNLFKNGRTRLFSHLWYQNFLPYDFLLEIKNFKCF